MVAWIRWTGEGRGEPLREERLWGLDVACAVFGGGDRRRDRWRFARMEEKTRRLGVNRVLVAPDFPWRERFRSLRIVQPLPLYRRWADVLALGWLEGRRIPPERSRVALAGNHVSPELRRAALCLGRRVREIAVDVPGEGGERLAAELRREYGIPVIPFGREGDLSLSFEPCPRPGQLRLWGEEADLDGLRLQAKGVEAPIEVEPGVLTLLWEQGKLGKERLRVTFAGQNSP